MASEVPWEVRVSLRAGTVYYFAHRGLDSPEPHYFIVVNSEPLVDELLVLVVASSKVAAVKQRRRTLPAMTLVEIAPADYQEFSVASIVDCNRVFALSLAELVERWTRQVVLAKRDLPQGLLGKLREGVKLSPLVETELKRLIR